MRAGRSSTLFAVIVALVSPACSDASTSSAPMTASAATSSSAAEADPDRQAFCEGLCKRATQCGIELAEALAKNSGKAADREVADRTKAGSADSEAECVARCPLESPKKEPEERTKRAKGCIVKSDCADFLECMGGVAEDEEEGHE